MLTTLVILATLAVAGLAWHQLKELKEGHRKVTPVRIRIEDSPKPRRRR